MLLKSLNEKPLTNTCPLTSCTFTKFCDYWFATLSPDTETLSSVTLPS